MKCELGAGPRLVSALRDFSSLCSLFSPFLRLRKDDTGTRGRFYLSVCLFIILLQQAICPVSFFEDLTVISVKSLFSFAEPPARLKPRSPHACQCNGLVEGKRFRARLCEIQKCDSEFVRGIPRTLYVISFRGFYFELANAMPAKMIAFFR